ncbi:MAG: adenylate/guanylate cyclase domain-containing protein [Bacteroidota bacterium]
MTEQHLIYEINRILDKISNAVNADRSTFFLLNPETQELESIIAQGVKGYTLKVPLGKGLIGKSVKKNLPIVENNPQSSPFFDDSYDRLLGYTTQNTVCVPIEDGKGHIVGGLQSLNSKKGRFGEDEKKTLISFSGVLAVLIQNSRLSLVNSNLKEAYSTLLDAFGKVTSELDFESLVPLIMSKAAEITSSERSTLYFLDEMTGGLKSKYAKGLNGNEIQINRGIAGLTLRTKKPQIVNNPYHHSEFDRSIDLKTGFTTRSILCTPIFGASSNILGVVQVINHKKGGYGQQELAILEGFATQIRIAIDNSILFNQINGMKNYLNVLIENMDNGILTLTNQGTIQTFNKKFLKMFELSHSDSFKTGRTLSKLKGEIRKVLIHCLRPIKTKKKFMEYDLTYTLGKTRKMIFNLSALPMENSAGDLVGVVGIFQDVSKEKRIRSNLSRYIPNHLVNEIINREDLSILKSKNRECSILFSDIRNFTSLTESLGANEVVRLLNSYFDSMVNSIHSHHGVLDKFIGDTVMGVFGVPYTNTNDTVNAITCALDMFNKLDTLYQSNHLGVNLKIGIGISTGKVISGNIGSNKRFEYTVIGNPVNLAARLENETKTYNARILICEQTYTKVASKFHCREIDSVFLKGKQNPVKIFTVDGNLNDEPVKQYRMFCHYFAQGLFAFRNRNYKMSMEKFEKAISLKKDDGPSRLFLSRCKEIMLTYV